MSLKDLGSEVVEITRVPPYFEGPGAWPKAVDRPAIEKRRRAQTTGLFQKDEFKDGKRWVMLFKITKKFFFTKAPSPFKKAYILLAGIFAVGETAFGSALG
jgi:hypothetical protein